MLDKFSPIALVATGNPAKAKDFYSETLGLTFLKDDGFALVFDNNGIMLRVSKVENFSPPNYSVLGWNVDDIEAVINELKTRGVVFERFAGFPQNDLGIATFPNGDRVAWFKDPDGNMLSLAQF